MAILDHLRPFWTIWTVWTTLGLFGQKMVQKIPHGTIGPNSPKWSKMVQNGLKWSKIVQSGPYDTNSPKWSKWYKMVRTVPRVQMVPNSLNGLEWVKVSKLVQSGPALPYGFVNLKFKKILLFRTSCILDDIFRDTPLDHTWLVPIWARNTVFGVFGHI